MSIFNFLIPFTEKLPPENVDLFVCSHAEDPKERTYGIMRYFKKGTVCCIADPVEGSSWEERMVNAVFNDRRPTQTIPETGYYFLSEGDGDCIWLHSSIKPLDSSYAVINPEDDRA
ncbi:MAG: hypothetical protein LKK26_06600 [Solobacterium sp.]|jgi:hypothetical protein|nr:hypothetical protein [Solobacterium sp.]